MRTRTHDKYFALSIGRDSLFKQNLIHAFTWFGTVCMIISDPRLKKAKRADCILNSWIDKVVERWDKIHERHLVESSIES